MIHRAEPPALIEHQTHVGALINCRAARKRFAMSSLPGCLSQAPWAKIPSWSIDVPADPTVHEIEAKSSSFKYPYPTATGFPAPARPHM